MPGHVQVDLAICNNKHKITIFGSYSILVNSLNTVSYGQIWLDIEVIIYHTATLFGYSVYRPTLVCGGPEVRM